MGEWVEEISGGGESASMSSQPPVEMQQVDAESYRKQRRKYRGPMMALSDEDLRLSIAGKQRLGA